MASAKKNITWAVSPPTPPAKKPRRKRQKILGGRLPPMTVQPLVVPQTGNLHSYDKLVVGELWYTRMSLAPTIWGNGCLGWVHDALAGGIPSGTVMTYIGAINHKQKSSSRTKATETCVRHIFLGPRGPFYVLDMLHLRPFKQESAKLDVIMIDS
jgi:hypothetical protein